jgi:hypothetical protein
MILNINEISIFNNQNQKESSTISIFFENFEIDRANQQTCATRSLLRAFGVSFTNFDSPNGRRLI